MSYNIFSKNASFKGDVSGTIENQVNDWDNQTIGGNKTFTNPITSSAGVMLSGSGKVSASFYYGDGSNLAGVGGTPGGNNEEVQFNNSGNFGASSNFKFVSNSELQVIGNVTASVNISASAFYGNGANITDIDAGNVTTGTLADARIPNLDASKITGGTFADARIPNLNASKITAGTFDTARISEASVTQHQGALEISGTQLVGTINNARLPSTISVGEISASHRISGAFFEGDGGGLINVTAAPIPTGSNTQIQFNNDGSLGGDADLTFLTGSNTLATTILSASAHVSASSYGGVAGTLIDSEGNFAGNNATFNQITASSEISSSADIFGLSFHGDGHTLNNVPMTAYVNNGVVFVDNPTQKIITSNANLTYNTDLTLANGDFVVSTGNITASGHVSASTFFGDGSNLQDLPAGSPTGSNTEIQFNADGAFGASSKFTFASSSATLEIAKSTTSNNEAMIFFHSGSNPFGHGSGSFIHSDSNDDLIIDLNNGTDRDIKFITRADSGQPQNKFVKLLIDGTATNKGVAIGNVDGFGIQDLYVSNTNQTRDTNIKFENRDQFDVILNLSSSTAETTFTNDKSSGNLKIRHDGGNIMFSSSVGPYAEFDAGSGYLFKATKLHYKEVACQLASSLSAGVAVFIPFVGTTDSVTQNFTHKFVAPFDGQIVKIMIRLDNTLGSTSSTLKVLKASDGTEHPTSVMETETLNFAAAGGYSANNTLTANFTSATFSSGDALGISFTPQGSPSTNIDLNMTIVFAYDELS